MAKKILWVFLASLLVVTLSLAPIVSIQAESSVDVLVTFYQQPGAEEVSLIQSLGGTVIEIYHIVPTILARMPSDKLDELQSDPRVKAVEEDHKFQSVLAGQVLPWGVDRVDAELVHPTYKGTGVKVAVLDTGIDLDHPDLAVAGNVTFVDGTVNGDDDNGHGTMVAGIVGALDNDIGVVGVAPEAALYSVKVVDYNGSALVSWILSGIQWATANSMQVINMSFGSPMNFPDTIKTALNNAYSAGIVIVAGAGNGGNPEGTGDNIWSPARYASVIAVGATDSLDARYIYSSTGYQLEVMAPGVDVYSTAMGGGYGNITGTSASSPHVAGAAALLIHDGMTSNVDVRNRLRNSATDLGSAGWDTQYGNGLVNAFAALSFSEPPDQTAPITTVLLSGTVGTNGWYRSNVTVTLSATDSPGGSGVALTEYSTDSGFSWNTYTSPFVIMTEGSNLVVLGRSWDNAGNDEGPPVFAKFKIDKTPPVVTETCNPTQMKRIGLGVMVNVSYTGTAEDSLSGLNNFQMDLIDGYGVYSTSLISYSGTATVEGWCTSGDRGYTFRFTMYDVAGNSATAQATFTVTKK